MTDVASLVQSHKVVVVSKTFCPYCVQAKNVLSQYAISDILILECDQLEGGHDIQSQSSRLSGSRTVPQVFIDGKFLGGGTETAGAHSNGQLKKLLTDAGAI